MVLLYMVTFTINIPPMLAYIPYMDPMGNGFGRILFLFMEMLCLIQHYELVKIQVLEHHTFRLQTTVSLNSHIYNISLHRHSSVYKLYLYHADHLHPKLRNFKKPSDPSWLNISSGVALPFMYWESPSKKNVFFFLTFC